MALVAAACEQCRMGGGPVAAYEHRRPNVRLAKHVERVRPPELKGTVPGKVVTTLYVEGDGDCSLPRHWPSSQKTGSKKFLTHRCRVMSRAAMSAGRTGSSSTCMFAETHCDVGIDTIAVVTPG